MTTAVPLYEGTFSVATDKVFRRIGKQDPPYKASLKLSINPFLIKNDEEEQYILFDAGLGDLIGEDTSVDTILNNLEQQGVSDFEITDIFLSHLHFDHMGGLAHRSNGYWELTFPDARIWVSGDGWKKLENAVEKEDDDRRDFIHFIDSHANLNFLSDKEEVPVPHVRVKQVGGHTQHHLALFYENGDDKFVMAGDVIGTRGAINRNYAAKYDFEPKQSMKIREEIQKLSHEKGHVIMAYHETDHPLFRLTDFDEKKGYKIENLSP